MSYHAPIVVISEDESPLLRALSDARYFPVVGTTYDAAPDALESLQPAAVVACGAGPAGALAALARRVAQQSPYVPLIAVDMPGQLPENAMPFTGEADVDRLVARLRAALRVRTLHATTLRRLSDDSSAAPLPSNDPLHDATVLLIGRGAAYPTLSVALGERVGVVGALSIEAAAKHLNTRDLDGIVLAEGFSPRVVDAFLTVLSEDARFRNLPVIASVSAPDRNYELPNLEFADSEPAKIVASALPLIRQHAFEARLSRALASLDAGGLLDPRTGLLTPAAFARDFATAVQHAQQHGGGLSVIRFGFKGAGQRVLFDAARIVSRLMRKMDFGVLQSDDAIVVVVAATDLRGAQTTARRLTSVIRQTSHGPRRDTRVDPDVSVATLMPGDSARSILARLTEQDRRRAAS
ncbi:GGDEF domain-containing protein [Rhodopseudomonas sp. B29]|uniref:GGDEF domain-containing protein n=1 Tax=Rhodopseudomonas sp. B29 TaxID=95607 RepID=UPI0003487EB0|nr:GGDEF domain-containing protein [Rhodopseudomonas sp. B29]